MSELMGKAVAFNTRMKAQRQSIETALPTLMSKSVSLAAGDQAKGREIASVAAECAGIMTIREWAKGMTTQPGEIVYDPLKAYAYVYTGKDAMTHSNQTYYPGAAGVYYWAIIPQMHEGAKVWPNVTGIIVAVWKDEVWWNSQKTKKYRYNGVDNNACTRYPGEPGVHQWVEVIS